MAQRFTEHMHTGIGCACERGAGAYDSSFIQPARPSESMLVGMAAQARFYSFLRMRGRRENAPTLRFSKAAWSGGAHLWQRTPIRYAHSLQNTLCVATALARRRAGRPHERQPERTPSAVAIRMTTIAQTSAGLSGEVVRVGLNTFLRAVWRAL